MILLTGASGFIGRSLCERLDPSSVLTVSSKTKSTSAAHSIVFDLTAVDKQSELVELVRPYPIEHVIHLAAVTPWMPQADFSLDLKMAETIAAVCNELQVPRLLYMSGWVVYDPQSPVPYTESMPLRPDTDYGKSKLAVERYLMDHMQVTKLIAMRAASIYGPGQTSAGLIPNLVGKALRGEQITLAAKDTRRDYLFIDDAVAAVQGLLETDISDSTALNIGSGQSISVQSVAETVSSISQQLYGVPVPVRLAEHVQEATPIDNRLSIEKAQALGVCKQQKSFSDGIRAYMQWRKRENIL